MLKLRLDKSVDAVDGFTRNDNGKNRFDLCRSVCYSFSYFELSKRTLRMVSEGILRKVSFKGICISLQNNTRDDEDQPNNG